MRTLDDICKYLQHFGPWASRLRSNCSKCVLAGYCYRILRWHLLCTPYLQHFEDRIDMLNQLARYWQHFENWRLYFARCMRHLEEMRIKTRSNIQHPTAITRAKTLAQSAANARQICQPSVCSLCKQQGKRDIIRKKRWKQMPTKTKWESNIKPQKHGKKQYQQRKHVFVYVFGFLGGRKMQPPSSPASKLAILSQSMHLPPNHIYIFFLFRAKLLSQYKTKLLIAANSLQMRDARSKIAKYLSSVQNPAFGWWL